MDKITALFDKLDLTKLVPQMDTLLEKLQFVAGIAILAGPLVMLLLGLWYLLLPPKEANYKAGFRTWFGMGSVEAWRMTQKIAGFTWGGIGLVLSVIMWLIRRNFAGKEIMQIVDTAFSCVLVQVVIAAVSYVLICLTAMALYNHRGEYRWNRNVHTEEEVPAEEPVYEPEPEETLPQDEVPGESILYEAAPEEVPTEEVWEEVPVE